MGAVEKLEGFIMDIHGQRVLVIGGSSGIGLAVARAARDEGANIVIASSNADKLSEASEVLGGAECVQFDVNNDNSVREYFSSAETFDHLVFTAGDAVSAGRGALENLDIDAAEAVFQVRFWGAARVAKYGSKTLSDGGSITLTTGMAAHRPKKGSAIPTALAGAIEFLTHGLAVELAPLRVNSVSLGGMHTGAWDAAPPEVREAELARIERFLLPRIGEPEEAAQAFLYLMKGTYTTGQIVYVEGGSLLGQHR